MINFIAKILTVPLLFVLSLAGYTVPEKQIYEAPPTQIVQNFGATLPQTVAVFETSLASPITSSATSMTLTANSIRGGGSISGYNCFTIDEGSAQAETSCGTVSGTAVTGMSRGISQSTGTTTVSALQFAHRRGANVKITDYPIIQILKAQNNGEDTFSNLLKYDNTVLITGSSASTTIATKYYVDNVAIAGAPDANTTTKGISQIATAVQVASSTSLGSTGASLVIPASIATSSPYTTGLMIPVTQNNGKLKQSFLDLTESFTYTGTNTFNTASTTFNASTTATNLTVGFNPTVFILASTTFTGFTTPQPAYIATSTGALQLSDANAYGAVLFDGFVVSNGSNGSNVYLQKDGIVKGFTGLTPGSKYYVQDAVGTIGTSVGTSEVLVGTAISATQIFIDKGTSGQYLGSIAFGLESHTQTSCVAYATSTFPMARTAIVQAISSNNGSNGWDISENMSLAKLGATTGSANFTVTDSGPTKNQANISSTWNTTTDVITMNGGSTANTTSLTCSGSAYFYR